MPAQPSLWRESKPARACAKCSAWLRSTNDEDLCWQCAFQAPLEPTELHLEAQFLPDEAVAMLVSTNG